MPYYGSSADKNYVFTRPWKILSPYVRSRQANGTLQEYPHWLTACPRTVLVQLLHNHCPTRDLGLSLSWTYINKLNLKCVSSTVLCAKWFPEMYPQNHSHLNLFFLLFTDTVRLCIWVRQMRSFARVYSEGRALLYSAKTMPRRQERLCVMNDIDEHMLLRSIYGNRECSSTKGC